MNAYPAPEAYAAPELAVYGDVRALTTAAGDSTQADQILVNGRVVDEQTGSLDLCATVNQNNCLGA